MGTRKRVPPRRQRKTAGRPRAPAPAPTAPSPRVPLVAPGFPVVGIGASAGGLAAFEAFLSGMPADAEPGMAFVLVQHLAPDHKSLLSELVRRYTSLKVFEVEDGMPVKANCAYIIPPNRDMAFLNGSLHLLEPSAPRGQRLPIDYFFRSLAQDQRERAVAVVLSGTGSDGTLGVRAIKGEGGMVMAQTPETTEYDGMPRSAIATGLVDFVLPPAEMVAKLIGFSAHAFGRGRPPLAGLPLAESALKRLFVLLRAQTGHDFSQYKLGTIQRRVERRMAVHRLDTIEAYVAYAQRTSAEVEALLRDLLISVTSFFRDPEVFQFLAERVLPRLLEDREAAAPVRVWSAGCSTGEEAYSLAILLAEYQEEHKLSFNVKVFATDIDNQAISTARAGIYPASIAADVSESRLARFFSTEPGGPGYRVHKRIRDLVVFSEQDAIRDPPFSRLDLISCRNLLIYLGPDLQRKLIPLFHYALNPAGVLLLGTSESVGEFGDLFATEDRALKVYRARAEGHASRRAAVSGFIPAGQRRNAAARRGERTPAGPSPLRALTEQALLDLTSPPAVLVDARGELQYLHGRTGRYLEPASGEARSANVLKMAREGVAAPLTSALRRAVADQEVVRAHGLKVKANGAAFALNLTIRPLSPLPGASPGSMLYLVVFEEAAVPPTGPRSRGRVQIGGGAEARARIAELTREVQAKEEYLQSSLEEQETTNEELKSSNEEMQSVNEELQSSNEELETSKEELQSVNEELATVNNELQTKVGELSQTNNDMINLMAGTGVGTIFVGHRLNILRFTPAATQVINLIPTDVGRPVGHIVSNLLNYNHLVEDVQGVLDSLAIKEVEVQSKSLAWYLLRIRPYRTQENVIEGAVITFVDITETRRLRQAERLAVVVRDASDAITLQDLEGRTLAWNPAAEQLYGWTEAEALALNVRDRLPKEERAEALERLRALGHAEALEAVRARRLTRDGRVLDVVVTATVVRNREGAAYALATTERVVGPAPGGDPPG